MRRAQTEKRNNEKEMRLEMEKGSKEPKKWRWVFVFIYYTSYVFILCKAGLWKDAPYELEIVF